MTKALPFDTPYFLDYYKGYRNKPGDLFDSERRFIPDLMKPGKSYLDLGCAVGGMYEVLKALAGDFRYTGLDISKEMVAKASRNYPGVDFRVCERGKLDFADGSFDRVITLGTTVHEPRFESLLRESWRVAREMLFFDVRLVPDLKTIRSVDEGFVLDGANMKYEYVVVGWSDLEAVLAELKPARVRAYGYWGKANKDTTLPRGYERICCATFLLEKGAGPARRELDLPWLKESRQ